MHAIFVYSECDRWVQERKNQAVCLSSFNLTLKLKPETEIEI
jgi:hypothetical protein